MPYTFIWDNGSTDEDPADLCTGMNAVTITDANGCEATTSVMIGNVSTLVIDDVAEDTGVSCFGYNDGGATVTVSGGEAPYTYLWDNGETNASAIMLIGGNHDVTVTDADGCEEIGSVTIFEPAGASITINILNDISCNGFNDGSAEAVVTGGTMPYTYEWSTGETDAIAIGLTPGMNVFSLTDANGCTQTATTMIAEPAVLSGTATEISPASCFGEMDGSAQVAMTGGTTPYSYEWDNGETDQLAIALGAGLHSTTITDANGCTTTASVTITEPTLLEVTVDGTTTANCTSCDGTADITVMGGVMPYTFSWSNGNTTEDPTDLCSGTSTITVTDANGCTATAGAMVGNTSTLLIDGISLDNPISCNGDMTAEISASVSGGQPPYTYVWSNMETTASQTGLGAGPYSLTVTDGDGCIAVDNINVTEPTALSSITNVINGVSCNGGSDGSAEVLPIGGTPPYTYQWDNSETTQVAVALDAGVHTVTVTDAGSCEITANVNISEPSALSISTSVLADVSCNGFDDGSAEATVSGGTMPYTFEWEDGQSDAIAIGLVAGDYDITVTDMNGCEITSNVTINEPAALTLSTTLNNDVSCNGGNDGSATTTPTGGTTPYTYAWSTGETDMTATALIAGMNMVSVTDANGCLTTDAILISEPMAIAISVDGTTDANCTSCDGTANITVSGGTIPYTYIWEQWKY